MEKRLRIILLSTALSSLLFCESEVKLEDVTVSANKMEENIKDVPQSITVIDEEIIQEKGIKNVNDIIKEVPNMISSNSSQGTVVSFRGLNQSISTEINPVVIYVDGVPYYDRFDFDPSLADVAQVEVLRGPQGTLYGKDAIGAVINIITKEPSNEWHGNIGAEYGNYNYMRGTFNTNGALIENKLFAGINGSFQKDDGWITNHYPGMKSNADEDRERKTSAFLLYKPTDELSARLTITDNYAKKNFLNGLALSGNTTSLNDIKREDAKNASFDIPSYEIDKVKSQSLNLTYDFDTMKLESTTTHKKSNIEGYYDTDLLSGTAKDGLARYRIIDMETWTQEVKLSGNNNNIKWVVGIYADDEKKNIDPYTMEMGKTPLSEAKVDEEQSSKTQAFFGQVMIPFVDKFELTLGGRYQKITKDIDATMKATYGGTAQPDFIYKDEKTWNTFLPKVALAYKNSDSLTTFASVSKGYMPGGFNMFPMSGGSDENSFEPQKSTNYEVGMKYTGDNYLLNASVFRMDIEDIHIYKIIGTEFFVDNAEKAHSQGIELDGKYFLTDNIELSGALAFIDATYDDYDIGSAKLDGERIENTPRYTANLGIAYVSEEGIYGRFDIYARGKTDYYNGTTNKFLSDNGAIISNLKVGYKIKDWDIYGYVKNITDEVYVNSYYAQNGKQVIGLNEPRTFGIGARYKF